MPLGLRAHRLHLYVLFWRHSNSEVTTLKYWRAYILCCHVVNLIQRVTLAVAFLFKVRAWPRSWFICFLSGPLVIIWKWLNVKIWQVTLAERFRSWEVRRKHTGSQSIARSMAWWRHRVSAEFEKHMNGWSMLGEVKFYQ